MRRHRRRYYTYRPDDDTSRIYIRFKVNGKLKAEYVLLASNLRSLSANLGEPQEAFGRDAVFTIDQRVEVIV